MSQLTLEIPDRSLQELHLLPHQAVGELRLAAAMKWHEMGRLSTGAAAELAGIPKPIFLSRMKEFGLATFQLTENELKSETPLV